MKRCTRLKTKDKNKAPSAKYEEVGSPVCEHQYPTSISIREGGRIGEFY